MFEKDQLETVSLVTRYYLFYYKLKRESNLRQSKQHFLTAKSYLQQNKLFLTCSLVLSVDTNRYKQYEELQKLYCV